jgi:hypothetical protein
MVGIQSLPRRGETIFKDRVTSQTPKDQLPKIQHDARKWMSAFVTFFPTPTNVATTRPRRNATELGGVADVLAVLTVISDALNRPPSRRGICPPPARLSPRS